MRNKKVENMTKEDLIKLVTEEVIKELQNFTFPNTANNSSCSNPKPNSNQNTAQSTSSFNKKLLTEKSVFEIIKSNIKELKIRKSTIVTPSAADLLSANKIKINRL